MSNVTNRRRFLKQLLSASAIAPLSLASMNKLAFAAGVPQLKVVFVVIPDGFSVDRFAGYDDGLWWPKTAEMDTENFELNFMSQALGDYSKQSLFLRSTISGPGNAGHNGWMHILRDSKASKTSIDLLLGEQMLGNNPLIKRIYAGPHSTLGAAWNISWDGANMLIPEINPYQLFEQVFGTSVGGGETPKGRSHLFDPINNQIQALRNSIGNNERQKLDVHLDSVEQVVADLNRNVPSAGVCDPSSADPAEGLIINSANYRDQVTDAHSDIIASALSCGTSRVTTFQIGRSADPVVVKSVSTVRNPHDCSHRYGSVDEWRDSRVWYIKKVKYLLDQLSAYPDPDVVGDSLLEHTLVVLTSEMADGAPEHTRNIPVTLIGGASGLLKNGSGNGRFFNMREQEGSAVNMQRIWATIGKAAAGITVPYEGNISTIPNIFTNV
jgi:hypothetical protein